MHKDIFFGNSSNLQNIAYYHKFTSDRLRVAFLTAAKKVNIDFSVISIFWYMQKIPEGFITDTAIKLCIIPNWKLLRANKYYKQFSKSMKDHIDAEISIQKLAEQPGKDTPF